MSALDDDADRLADPCDLCGEPNRRCACGDEVCDECGEFLGECECWDDDEYDICPDCGLPFCECEDEE